MKGCVASMLLQYSYSYEYAPCHLIVAHSNNAIAICNCETQLNRRHQSYIVNPGPQETDIEASNGVLLREFFWSFILGVSSTAWLEPAATRMSQYHRLRSNQRTSSVAWSHGNEPTYTST